MEATKNLVLNHQQVQQKIMRMAFEIYERNAFESHLFLAGIDGSGAILANLLAEKLKEISPIEINVLTVRLNKTSKVQENVEVLGPQLQPDDCLVLVDDVLNTGKTLVFALEPFLKIPLKKIEVAVLVNRSHKKYPVTPDYAGLELSTMLHEHISVDLSPNHFSVHLH
jgi:pyrimidine operon attenuation protein / uracil phosphoribosyltransferase